MKYLSLLGILLCFFACKNAPERPEPILDPSYQPAEAASTTPTTKPTEPAQNAAGVWHYTCENGCAGGAGSAVPCATCGTTLKHNQAYHSNNATANTTPATTTASPMSVPTTSSQGNVNITPSNLPKPTEPAQNAAGVWHYTCENGCSGGAGSAIACASCGSKLKHNQAYHN